jgi:hypothetical protein
MAPTLNRSCAISWEISKELNFNGMVRQLESVVAGFFDKRTGKNSSYSIRDAGIGAFSVFFYPVGPWL